MVFRKNPVAVFADVFHAVGINLFEIGIVRHKSGQGGVRAHKRPNILRRNGGERLQNVQFLFDRRAVAVCELVFAGTQNIGVFVVQNQIEHILGQIVGCLKQRPDKIRRTVDALVLRRVLRFAQVKKTADDRVRKQCAEHHKRMQPSF